MSSYNTKKRPLLFWSDTLKDAPAPSRHTYNSPSRRRIKSGATLWKNHQARRRIKSGATCWKVSRRHLVIPTTLPVGAGSSPARHPER